MLQNSTNNNDDFDSAEMKQTKRRIANRRSAQLSRARKKTQMQELESNNCRMKHIVDIIESHPGR
jgi:hypothetical protein